VKEHGRVLQQYNTGLNLETTLNLAGVLSRTEVQLKAVEASERNHMSISIVFTNLLSYITSFALLDQQPLDQNLPKVLEVLEVVQQELEQEDVISKYSILRLTVNP